MSLKNTGNVAKSLNNEEVVDLLIDSLRYHSNSLGKKRKSVTEYEQGSNDPHEEALDREEHRIKTAKAIKFNSCLTISSWSVPKTISDQFKGTNKFTAIAKVIDDIRQNIPLVRREDGSPHVVDTCRAIKEFDINLWNKFVIYSLLPRSTWGSVKDNQALGTFTPILLAAYKPEVKFSEWDTIENFSKPVAMYLALGTELANMMYAKPKNTIEWNKTGIKLLSLNGAARVCKGVSLINLIDNFDDLDRSMYRPDYMASKNALKNCVYMQSQTWIANPILRNPDTMILDIYDWDLVPEPLVALEEPTVISSADWDDI